MVINRPNLSKVEDAARTARSKAVSKSSTVRRVDHLVTTIKAELVRLMTSRSEREGQPHRVPLGSPRTLCQRTSNSPSTNTQRSMGPIPTIQPSPQWPKTVSIPCLINTSGEGTDSSPQGQQATHFLQTINGLALPRVQGEDGLGVCSIQCKLRLRAPGQLQCESKRKGGQHWSPWGLDRF